MISINKKEEGFTLIELLVVVAIISLLTLITYGGINDARDRAKNTKRNEIALQYFKSLQLYVSGGGNLITKSGSYCLGYETDEPCRGTTIKGDVGINNMFASHYPDMPKDYNYAVPVVSGLYARGIEYSCTDISVGNCNLIWYLGADAECAAGATRNPGTTYTQCVLDLSIY